MTHTDALVASLAPDGPLVAGLTPLGIAAAALGVLLVGAGAWALTRTYAAPGEDPAPSSTVVDLTAPEPATGTPDPPADAPQASANGRGAGDAAETRRMLSVLRAERARRRG